MLLFAIDRVQVADYLAALVGIYTILILIRILLTWVPNMPENRALRMVVQFIEDVTDPYLAIWRKIIPSFGGIDFSPIAAVFALNIVGGIVISAVHG